MYQSIARVRKLPDFIQIWPGHGAGSPCGKSLGAIPMTTLGYENKITGHLINQMKIHLLQL